MRDETFWVSSDLTSTLGGGFALTQPRFGPSPNYKRFALNLFVVTVDELCEIRNFASCADILNHD